MPDFPRILKTGVSLSFCGVVIDTCEASVNALDLNKFMSGLLSSDRLLLIEDLLNASIIMLYLFLTEVWGRRRLKDACCLILPGILCLLNISLGTSE